MNLATKKHRIAEHIEVIWTADRTPPCCPNCGSAHAGAPLLEVDFRPPGKSYSFILNDCAHCGAKFYDHAESIDYSSDTLIEIGWHVYQIQIGAGLWPITAPLARICKPAGARLLEIGGAYGFGLDFGIRAQHWTGEGFDPSPLAAFGADELGLELKQVYFEEKDLSRGPYDVLVATEVIEHLPDPPGFLKLMFKAAAPDGVLLLTTPDGERITPDLSAGELLPMLSPGAHLVLQTATSLRLALQNAGFAQVKIEHSGLSLIAYASASPFELAKDAGNIRALYRHYLVERSRLTSPGSDLCFGFAGRGLFEAVNDSDFAAAAAAWQTLLPAAMQRFGLALEKLDTLPEGAMTASLDELHRLMPLGLGMILYSRAQWQLAEGVKRAEMLPVFRLAADALDALQAALGRRSLIDGLTADLRLAVESEIILCLAEMGDPDCVPAAIALWRQDATQIVTAWRAFIRLVNAAAFGPANALQQAASLYAPSEAMDLELRQDALFTTGILALQTAEDRPRAQTIFAELRHLLLQSAPDGTPGHLFWPALRGEATALRQLGREDEADALLEKFVLGYTGAPEDLKRDVSRKNFFL